MFLLDCLSIMSAYGAFVEDSFVWIESSETTYCIRGFYPMPVANKELAMARGLFTEHRAVLRTSETIRLGIGELFKSQQEESSPGTRQLGAQGTDF